MWSCGFTIVWLVALGTGIGMVLAVPNVTLVSKLNPSSYGQTVTFAATVKDPPIPKAQIKGFMTFADETGAILGMSNVTSGVASFRTRVLTGGNHSITANYTATTGESTASNTVLQQVNVGSSKSTISTTKAVERNGRTGSVKVKVTPVAPAFGVPTGWVDFWLDTYDPTYSPYWPYVPLDATGTAYLDFMYLYVGCFNFIAVYSGDTNFASSVSTVLNQTIIPNAPIANATYSPSTIAVGGSSKLTVSAKNPTKYAMFSVALGVQPYCPIVLLSAPTDALCEARLNLYYCLISVPAGATRSLVFKVAPNAPVTCTSYSYARNIDTMDETGASAVLTVQ